MSNRSLTRRRMIAIVATAAGSAFLTGGRTAQAGDPVRWHGSALGAQVSIEIYHPDRTEAERLVVRCVLDVRRLEQQFSLYRADSAICTLNRTGILVSPDDEVPWQPRMSRASRRSKHTRNSNFRRCLNLGSTLFAAGQLLS